MIEKTVIDYLKRKLPDEEISAEVPRKMPDRFITVEKTGSQQIGIGLFESTLAVQSWELSKLKAAELSEKVCKCLRDITEVDEVSRSRGSDYDYTDLSTKHYRYQAVFTLTHY